MMLLSIGGRMFRVRAFKAQADDANTLRLRHLHSPFFDDDDSNNRAHSDLLSNRTADFTSDHYHRPAADGVGGPSITSNNTMSSAPTNHTQANNSIDELLSDNSHHDHYNQGLSFTLIFLALMIVYIALFCIQFRREASTTAANDVNEQRKLEERKKRIGEALVSRLIVEDADDIKVDLEEGEKDEDTRANAESDFHDSGEDGKENQVMNDEDQGHYDDEEMGMKEAAAEEKTLAQEDDAASDALTKQQDETLSTSTEETTVATSSSSSGERTIDTMPSNSVEVVPTIDTSSSSSSTSMLAVSSSPPPPPPPSPPSSSFRKYADALFCKKCYTHNSDATNNNNTSPGNKSSSDSPSSLPTITLSTIQQTYGEEECIICFSKFQVGDLVAWSKHQINGCTHVFHDDCLTRWLLVRDCCPMCRRSYLNGVVG